MAILAPVDRSSCVQYETHWELKDALWAWNAGNFTYRDLVGSLQFKIKAGGKFAWQTYHMRLQDASGQTLLFMKRKRRLGHYSYWKVYRGDDDTSNNVLFRVERVLSGLFVPNKYAVFIPTSTNPAAPEFTAEMSCRSTELRIFFRGTPVATAKSRLLPAISGHKVTISPSVDRAFIAALVVLVLELEE